jgi:hypothetical protein
MPIGIVAGVQGSVVAARAVQLLNQIDQNQRNQWRIFYFQNGIGNIAEYTSRTFNNVDTVHLNAQTHCVIFGHGQYVLQGQNPPIYRSTDLSIFDVGNAGTFDVGHYVDWLRNTAVAVQTIIVAACHAGEGQGGTPIQRLVAVRPNIQADGPTTPLMGLQGVNVNWNAAAARNGWRRFTN